MNPLELIQKNLKNFTKTEENIAMFILNNPKDCARNTSIDYIVTMTNSSKAAMIRFAKKLGYNGYTEFKYDLARFLVSNSYSGNQENNQEDIISYAIDNYCDLLQAMKNSLSCDTLINLSKEIINSNKNKIFALNRTALAAKQLQMRALKVGFDIVCYDDKMMMEDVINTLDKRDLCIIYSSWDNVSVYKNMVEKLKEREVKVALVTMNSKLSYAGLCDYFILLPPINNRYGYFMDAQPLYFIFDEILLAQLSLTINEKKEGQQ